jgi:DNA-binding response OmpR family regulator
MAKILIADDDKTMLGLLCTLLEIEGNEPMTQTRPEGVIPIARKHQPDVILLDVHLAGGDSLTTLKEIKEDPDLQGTPVLMISGMEMRDECIKMGADDFILKPFHPRELLERIHRLLPAKSA